MQLNLYYPPLTAYVLFVALDILPLNPRIETLRRWLCLLAKLRALGPTLALRHTAQAQGKLLIAVLSVAFQHFGKTHGMAYGKVAGV